ncbi:hypothetical protein HYV74_03300 [Candidatus Uhrbacteria bacterium]|nr:hypothetical protein [Candidatus Uhrbacteria bacterium]
MRCTVEQLDPEHTAALRTEHGELIRVPTNELPSPLHLGDVLFAHFASDSAAPNTQARAILNELLSTE